MAFLTAIARGAQRGIDGAMRLPATLARASRLGDVAFAVCLWCVVFAVTAALSLARIVPSEPYDIYIAAGQRWLAGAPLYDLSDAYGFLYLPQAAMLIAPFAKLGHPLAALLWRAIGWALLSVGVWRAGRALLSAEARSLFPLTSALVAGLAANGLASGQLNVAVAALTLHATADLVARRWWAATVALSAGLALKPLMAALLLLVWALYRPMTWRLVIGIIIVGLVPWIFAPHTYLVAQYQDFIAKLAVCGRAERHYEDLWAMLRSFGLSLSASTFFAARVVAAVATFGLALAARRRVAGQYAVVLIAAFASSYLMLFNPRTQTNSYCIAGAVAALLVAWALRERRFGLARALLVIALAWLGNSNDIAFATHWMKPLACLVFVGVLVREVIVAPRRTTAGSRGRGRG